jgi:hypothetical protein
MILLPMQLWLWDPAKSMKFQFVECLFDVVALLTSEKHLASLTRFESDWSKQPHCRSTWLKSACKTVVTTPIRARSSTDRDPMPRRAFSIKSGVRRRLSTLNRIVTDPRSWEEEPVLGFKLMIISTYSCKLFYRLNHAKRTYHRFSHIQG